jgi:hypothetical protein
LFASLTGVKSKQLKMRLKQPFCNCCQLDFLVDFD